MVLIPVATAMAHHATADGDPTRTLCGQELGDAAVREAHAEMVNCLGCLMLMPHPLTERQLVALGMLTVQKVQRRFRGTPPHAEGTGER